MHGIYCIDRSSEPGDVHNMTVRRIELYIPLPIPFLQYSKVTLELLLSSCPLTAKYSAVSSAKRRT